MSTNVVMPQMGESITEGTITKWLKKVGDRVEKDESIFEISTDKVDAEIPASAAGVLAEVRFAEGQTVQVNSVVAVIATAAAASPPQSMTNGGFRQPATSEVSAKGAGKESQPTSTGGTSVVMPQMGESITEGTITKWLKNVGDRVEKDEPIFEISTDKVDAEIPAPVAGVLAEIRCAQGETVQVNAVVALIDDYPPPLPDMAENEAPAASTESVRDTATQQLPEDRVSDTGSRQITSSPLAHRIAHEYEVDLAGIPATGLGGPIMRDDVLRYMKGGDLKLQQRNPELKDEVVPIPRMRKIIAQRMVESVRISPHVHTVYKIDMTRVVRMRERSKDGFEQREGIKLTYLPFIAAAVVAALCKHPIINSSMVDGTIHHHGNINLGIAVSVDWGLIVPVVRCAEQLSFRGLAHAMSDLAGRARSRKLNPDEVTGSTFTISNLGVFGDELSTPIINQPDAAILCTSGLKKEPVVITAEDGTDTIAIRSMQCLTLGFDHRLIDGANAGKFMLELKAVLEGWRLEVL
jgi:pyruvate dehydrogenase E2 component (dihydrolipoamide acetyltransferase)